MTILPIELWIKVLQHHYEDEGRSTDYETLTSCSLVCSSWREHAQRCLFASVGRDIYRSSEMRVSFEAAIHPSTERGKVLGSYVRNLNVNLDRTFNFTDGTLDMRKFTLLLSWCPRLYELSLHVFDIPKFNEMEMAELQFIANSVKLRALRLLRFGIQSTIAYQLISVWPTIQYLTIGSEIAAPPPLPLPSIQLHELNFCRTSMRPRCLEWFLSGSETSLRILKFRDTPGQLMKRFLAKHTPYLKSLRMQRYDKDTADILRLCKRLEELVLFQLPIFIDVKDLPLTIEHFSFYFRATTRHPLIALITTLPNLRAITCDKDVEQYPDFAAIRSACDAKHVELKMHSSFYREDS
jgi:hypothetical protein